MNPLQRVWSEQGQAIWLDTIRRSLVTTGGLDRLVGEDGLRGVTSNPSIFCQAIAGTSEYDDAVVAVLDADQTVTTEALYEMLAIEDIRSAADVLRPVYDASRAGDGFVSLEVSPHLAHDTDGTVAAARRLWAAVDRPNLMIKVPATAAGVPAVERLIADGINVNATLMFSLAHYDAVAGAYLRGVAACEAPDRVASVASFFVSRVDTVVDAALEAIGTAEARELLATAAIANARAAWARFREVFAGSDFVELHRRGARVQRPLWASTSTKNPAYSDVMYVEQLIGRDTVNTLPMATLEAFRDHGRVVPGLERPDRDPRDVLDRIAGFGIDLDAVTEQLQVDGVAAFAASYDELLAALDAKRAVLAG